MGKNNIVNVKTFETFQQENSQYQPIVIEALNDILGKITKGSKQAGDWVIEGNVDYNLFPEMGETSAHEEKEINFTNQSKGVDIFIRYNFSVEQGRVTPDTDITPGDTEYNQNLQIDDVMYYTENGNNEFTIVVNDEVSKIVEAVLDKINASK
jgi:hypothetical protein